MFYARWAGSGQGLSAALRLALGVLAYCWGRALSE